MGGKESKALPIVHTLDRKDEIRAPADFLHIEFEPKPFAHGSCRETYRGRIISSETETTSVTLDVGGGDWIQVPVQGRKEYPCVVKMFKEQHVEEASEWDKDLKALTLCRELADEFNKAFEGRGIRKISFAKAVLFKASEPGATEHFGRRSWACLGGSAAGGVALRAAVVAANPELVPAVWIGSALVGGVTSALGTRSEPSRVEKGDIVCAEPFLDGRFVKVNSNSGAWKNSPDSAVAQAFSHWTWAKRKVLVCDLQGVMQDDGRWLFTDPAVHTHEVGGSGTTDLGEHGVHAFFHYHKCNNLCRDLERPDDLPSSPPALVQKSPKTTFSFQVQAVDASLSTRKQTGGTCYAHACATVIRAAESRIIGRSPENHGKMVERIVSKYGVNGGYPAQVLSDECPGLSLHHREVSQEEAEAAIGKGHAILVSFYLDATRWEAFRVFFEETPRKVLDKLPEGKDTKKSGHAVVIVGQSQTGRTWFLKNSWGSSWANNGYCRIRKSVLATMTPIFRYVYFLEKPDSQRSQSIQALHEPSRSS